MDFNEISIINYLVIVNRVSKSFLHISFNRVNKSLLSNNFLYVKFSIFVYISSVNLIIIYILLN